jgi:hypothetical protein
MHRQERLFMMGGETGKSDSHEPQLSGAEKAAIILIDERIGRWSPEQAEATAHLLHPANQYRKQYATEIAQRLSITPQAVGYRLKGAGARQLDEALAALELDWTESWSCDS